MTRGEYTTFTESCSLVVFVKRPGKAETARTVRVPLSVHPTSPGATSHSGSLKQVLCGEDLLVCRSVSAIYALTPLSAEFDLFWTIYLFNGPGHF